MIQTRLTSILGIQHPIIQAGMTAATSARLAAAVSNAGGLGSVSASLRSPTQLEQEVIATRSQTDRPFAVNFIVPMIIPEAYSAVLAQKPAVIVLAVGCGPELVRQAQQSGCKVFVQVNTVTQARQALEQGADGLIAQGAESGGFTGSVGTMTLVPQIVDAVSPTPVIAAGGIFDGRGLAAAISLGADGVNIGTRFLAAAESPILPVWQEAVLAASSEEAETRDFLKVLVPPSPLGFPARPRTLWSDFIAEWQGRAESSGFQPDDMLQQIFALAMEGRIGEIVPLAGQSAGALNEVRPVADIIDSMVRQAEAASRGALTAFEPDAG